MNFNKKNATNIKKKNFFHNIFYYIKKNIKYFILFLFFIMISFFFIWFYYPDCKNFYKNLFCNNKNIYFKKFINKKNLYENLKNFEFKSIPKKKKKLHKKNIFDKNFKNPLPGFELLDQERFGISSFNEQINYQRALEGELSKTIEKLNFINYARVHIAFPQNSYILDKKNYSSASVFINLSKKNKSNFEIYYSIINLLSTSVYNLPKKNITVINQFGELFKESNYYFKNKINFKKIDYINKIENIYKKKINDVLIPIFGLNNIITQISEKITFHKKKKIKLHNKNFKENNSDSNISLNDKNDININLKKNIYNNFYNSIDNDLQTNFNKKQIKKLIFLNKFNKSKTKKDMLLNKNINFDINKKNDNLNFHNKVVNKKNNFNQIKHFFVNVIVNYKKDDFGKYIPLNENEILDIKKLIRQTIETPLCKLDSINVFNYKFMDLEPPIIKYIPIKKKESINRTIFLVPWFLLFFFLMFFMASFYSFKKFTKKFQSNNINMLSILKKHFEDYDSIKENFEKNNIKINKKKSNFFKKK